MRIEGTAGNVTYWSANCDCGLTGGCEKCRPFTINKQSKQSRLDEIRRESLKKYNEVWKQLAES